MANILLVTPTNRIRTDLQNWSTPHLGVWRIAGYLEKHGHSASVWDTILDDEAPSGEWNIIGFSVTHDTLPDDLSLMRRMAGEHGNALIVAGGVEVATNYEQVLEHVPRLYGVVVGEGEKPLLAFAEVSDGVFGHHSLAVPGTVTRRHQNLSVEEFTEFNLSMPFKRMRHRDHWKIVKSLRPDVTPQELYCVRLNTSTFCDRACKFCSVTHIHRMAAGHVCKPITMTGEDTQELVRKVLKAIPETRTIYFHDDSFCLFPEKVQDFFTAPPKLDYHVQASVAEVDPKMLAHMAKGGCKRISYGVESVVPHVLKDIGKGITVETVDEALEWTIGAGIEPVVLVMLFCPTCSVEDMVLIWRKLKEWEGRGILLSIMSFIRPYHGSWYFNSGLHDIEWERVKGIKRPKALLPDDPDVRAMWYEFEKRLADIEKKIPFHWKGVMSSVMLAVLGGVLTERGAI